MRQHGREQNLRFVRAQIEHDAELFGAVRFRDLENFGQDATILGLANILLLKQFCKRLFGRAQDLDHFALFLFWV